MKKLQITNKELISLHNGLMGVGKLEGVNFCYAVAVNLAKIKPLIEGLAKAQKPSEDYLKFLEDAKRISAKHSEEFQDDEQSTENTQQTMKQIPFSKEYFELEDKYKQAISKHEGQMKDFEALLAKEVEIEIETIDKTDLPLNITAGQLSSIISMIKA